MARENRETLTEVVYERTKQHSKIPHNIITLLVKQTLLYLPVNMNPTRTIILPKKMNKENENKGLTSLVLFVPDNIIINNNSTITKRNEDDDDDDDDVSSLGIASFAGETFDDEIMTKKEEEQYVDVDWFLWESDGDNADINNKRRLPVNSCGEDCQFPEKYNNLQQTQEYQSSAQLHQYGCWMPSFDHDHHDDDHDEEVGVFRGNNSNAASLPSYFSIYRNRQVRRNAQWMMRSFIWMILILSVILTLLIVSVMVLHVSTKDDSTTSPMQDMPFPAARTTDLYHDDDIPSSFRFHHDWTFANAEHFVMHDYTLHPRDNGADIRITVMTPSSHNFDNVTLYLVTDGPWVETVTSSSSSCQATWPTATTMTASPQTLVQVRLPPRDTQVVACVDHVVVASALHLYVTTTHKVPTNTDYQISTINFISGKDSVVRDSHHYSARPVEMLIAQQDADDHLYIIIFTSQPNPQIVYMPDGPAVGSLHDMLTDHPYRPHHCDGTGSGLTSHDATRVVDGEFHAGMILWDVSAVSQGHSIWNTLLWECDTTTRQMQRPVISIAVENFD
eukprot:scaffold2997_cov182-Amphora_coffeaeformis.AAC.13